MASTTVSDSPLPVCDPGEVGFIPERLAALGPAMQHHIDTGRLPNAVTLVARHGHVVHFEARGRLAVDSRRRRTATPSSVSSPTPSRSAGSP